jgi:uncharacterized protein YndB with AHSA1/START domain
LAKQEIDIRARTEAGPESVWALLGDSASWPSWTPIEEVELLRSGGPDGVGEVRTFKTGRVTVREEIVERVPERRLTYVLLAGLAVRDYRAEIELTPIPGAGGTEIRWHTTFRAKVPGTGWLYRRALGRATQDFVDGLATSSLAGAGKPGGAG